MKKYKIFCFEKYGLFSVKSEQEIEPGTLLLTGNFEGDPKHERKFILNKFDVLMEGGTNVQ